MAAVLDSPGLAPPSLALLLLEGRAPWELGAYYASLPLLRMAPRGDGHPVLVIPGLGGSEVSTRPLRAFLKDRGYAVHDWGLGRNIGSVELLSPLLRRLRDTQAHYGGTVSLVGWSLGGVYAREAAKRAPAQVRQVITLASPFSGTARASNVWRVFELLSGGKARDDELRASFRAPPPVPTTAIYSRSDGIVAWQCCAEVPGPEVENIEVESSHIGLGHHPLTLYAVADRLAQAEGAWLPFQRSGVRRLFYPDPARR